MRPNDLILYSDGFALIVDATRHERAAEFELHQALTNGNVRSFLRHLYMKSFSEDWQEIEAESWKQGHIYSSTKPDGNPGYRLFDDQYKTFGSILYLSLSDIMKNWNVTSSNNPSKVADAPRKGIGGVKGDYDWEKYLIEAAAYLHENSTNCSQAQLFEHLWALYGGREGGPSLSQMKTHIAPLWRRMRAIDDG